MPALFAKHFDAITASDMAELIGCSESATLEFKKTLSGKDGRPDGWLNGDKLGDHARDKLFKEIIAMANASGGHLILGIEEDKGNPPVAIGIEPVPRCADLAERLSRAAERIDPPVPLLLIREVIIEGDAGVVIFRIPESRSAPHRGLDKECYVRRGTSSVPIGMREIQDMTLAAGRRDERLDKRFEQASIEFGAWMNTPLPQDPWAIGFRLTATPAGAPFNLGRLYGRNGLIDHRPSYSIEVNSRKFEVSVVHQPAQSRPIVSGARWTYSESEEHNRFDIYKDGTVNLYFKIGPRRSNDVPFMYIGWILAYAIKILLTSNILRNEAAAPDQEYALEMEARSSNNLSSIQLINFKTSPFEDFVGDGLKPLPFIFPRMSFGSFKELDDVITAISTDLFDACGQRQINPFKIHVSLS